MKRETQPIITEQGHITPNAYSNALIRAKVSVVDSIDEGNKTPHSTSAGRKDELRAQILGAIREELGKKRSKTYRRKNRERTYGIRYASIQWR